MPAFSKRYLALVIAPLLAVLLAGNVQAGETAPAQAPGEALTLGEAVDAALPGHPMALILSPVTDMFHGDSAQAASTTSPKAVAGQKPGKPLTLEEAISMVLPSHPKIQAANQALRAGQFNTLGVEAAFWPQLFFNANRDYVWSQLFSTVTTPAVPPALPKTKTVKLTSDTATTNYAFNGAWTLFDFGRTYYGVKSSQSIEKSLMDNVDNAEQTAVYDVMDAYYNVLKFQSLVKVANESLDDANSHLKQAQAFYEVGTKPKFDVTQAEVQVNNAKVQVIQAVDAVRVAVVNLNTRLNIAPLAPTEVVDRPDLEPLEKPLEHYLQQALANRPDLKNLEDVLHSNEMLVKSNLAGFLPTISTTASYGWSKQDKFGALNNDSLIIAANVPIFEGFRTVANVGQARATVLANKYNIEDAKNDILNQVGISYIAIEDARASIDALKVSVRSARENLDIANGRYEAGVGAILDVTDAQVSLTSAEANLAQAFYNYHLAYSKLLRTVGVPPRNKK